MTNKILEFFKKYKVIGVCLFMLTVPVAFIATVKILYSLYFSIYVILFPCTYYSYREAYVCDGAGLASLASVAVSFVLIIISCLVLANDKGRYNYF